MIDKYLKRHFEITVMSQVFRECGRSSFSLCGKMEQKSKEPKDK